MAGKERPDYYEEYERAALICMEDNEQAELLKRTLTEVGYRVHLSVCGEDVFIKLRTTSYRLMVIDEEFGGATLESNQALQQVHLMSLDRRRHQFVILVGREMKTDDDLCAFAQSVDLVLSQDDLVKLPALLKSRLAQQASFYLHYFDAVNSLEAA